MKNIEDATGKETEFVTYEAEVSHKNIPGQWYLNGQEVQPSPKFQVLLFMVFPTIGLCCHLLLLVIVIDLYLIVCVIQWCSLPNVLSGVPYQM